jgi:endoglycosylceramidase
MRQRRLPWLLLAFLSATTILGCESHLEISDDAATRLPALDAEPDPVNGGRIVDAEGREVLLRGVNVNALAEYWAYGDLPTTFPFTEDDADLIAGIGWNTVRLLLSWSRVEPQPGMYDDEYIAQARAAVDLLAERGIYSIIDLHQDAWGATLAADPSLECPSGQEPGFGWDGAPDWATFDDNQARCALAGIREANRAVRAAFIAFWNDDQGPGGIGIRTRYVQMLGELAARFADDPAVAGYDLMNEPNAFPTDTPPDEAAALADLYSDALAEIRRREQEAGGFAHLIFFEPTALWSAFGNGAPPDFARDRDVVYAPHIYTGGFDGGPITRAAFEVAQSEATGFGGAPVLSGEWGADPRRAEDDGDGYFLAHQALQDEFHFGATLWTWRESCGDPHKASDVRAGRVPYVWGEFEVDCSNGQNTVQGMRPLVQQLTRAYVRAAPGQLATTLYDPATGAFDANGNTTESGQELLVFYPSAQHTIAAVNGNGIDRVEVLPAPGDNSYIVARTNGGPWAIEVVPAS